MIRRINLYGGPGTGKSTNAALLFSQLKEHFLKSDVKIELVREVAKEWVWAGRDIGTYDQHRIWAEQLHRETSLLDAGVDIVITDSPILLGPFFAEAYGLAFQNHMTDVSLDMDERFRPLNIFLDREDRHYDPAGRLQSEQEAREIDKDIDNFVCLYSHNDDWPYKRKPSELLDTVLKALEGYNDRIRNG